MGLKYIIESNTRLQIHLLCEKLQNHDLSAAYDRAKTRVELLRRNETVGNIESSLLAVVPRKAASSPEASPSNSESSLLGKVPRKWATHPEASPSNSESSFLAKVPRKTAPVPQKLPSEQDEAPKEEPAVEATSQIADTDKPARSSRGIAPKTDGLNLGSSNADADTASGLPWGCAGKTESASPLTSWEPTTMGIPAGWSSKMSDTSLPSASIKVDPGERARSSIREKSVSSPERYYSTSGAVVSTRELNGAADHSSDAETNKESRSSNGATVAYSQMTSDLGRGRGRALPFWMAKKGIQEESGDSTKENNTNFPVWMTSDATKEVIETTQTDVSRRGVNGKCCSTLLATPVTSGLGHQSVLVLPELVSNDSSWDSSRAPPLIASLEARYRDDGRPDSTERENSSSYPSASRERENFSVYPSASGSYRSVRPA
jgi:hypothetical protein